MQLLSGDPLITDAADLQGSAMPRILKKSHGLLVGKSIRAVGYIERDGYPWPCIELNDGTCIIGSRDDEGNGPGSLFLEGATEGETLCETQLA